MRRGLIGNGWVPTFVLRFLGSSGHCGLSPCVSSAVVQRRNGVGWERLYSRTTGLDSRWGSWAGGRIGPSAVVVGCGLGRALHTGLGIETQLSRGLFRILA